MNDSLFVYLSSMKSILTEGRVVSFHQMCPRKHKMALLCCEEKLNQTHCQCFFRQKVLIIQDLLLHCFLFIISSERCGCQKKILRWEKRWDFMKSYFYTSCLVLACLWLEGVDLVPHRLDKMLNKSLQRGNTRHLTSWFCKDELSQLELLLGSDTTWVMSLICQYNTTVFFLKGHFNMIRCGVNRWFLVVNITLSF